MSKLLTNDEKNALSDYKTGNSDIIAFLRMNHSQSDDPEVFNKIELIKSALAKNTTDVDLILWRGCSQNEIENNRSGNYGHLEIPFFSTSSRLKSTIDFIKKNSQPALIKITVPKGYNAVEIPGKQKWAKEEKEFLLQGNINFYIKQERIVSDQRILNRCGLNKDFKYYTIELI